MTEKIGVKIGKMRDNFIPFTGDVSNLKESDPLMRVIYDEFGGNFDLSFADGGVYVDLKEKEK